MGSVRESFELKKQHAQLQNTVFDHCQDPFVDGDHDPKSGFCNHTGIFRSVYKLGPDEHVIAANHNLDVASFVLSNLPRDLHISETKTALVDSATGASFTYHHVRRSALSLAAVLHHGLCLRKGEVVLLLIPASSILYPVVCLAILATGAIITLADPLTAPNCNAAAAVAQVVKQVHYSGAKLAICTPEDARKVAEAAGIPVLITTTAGTSSSTTCEPPNLLSIEELIACGDVSASPSGMSIGITQSDVAALLYASSSSSNSSSSSSSSGKSITESWKSESKGKNYHQDNSTDGVHTRTLTHGDLISACMVMKWGVEKERSVAHHQDQDQDATLCVLSRTISSISHVYGGLAFLGLGLLCTGSTTVVMTSEQPSDYSQAMMVDAIKKHRISNILAVPPAFLSAYMNLHDADDLSLLRRVSTVGGCATAKELGTGAAAAAAAARSEFRHKFPWVVVKEAGYCYAYGMMTTVFACEKEARDHIGSAGKLMPLLEGMVVEPKSGRPVGPGIVGELWLKGPALLLPVLLLKAGSSSSSELGSGSAGHLGHDDGKLAALKKRDNNIDGNRSWLWTGDLAYFDKDGFLYIVDQIKSDLMINNHEYYFQVII